MVVKRVRNLVQKKYLNVLGKDQKLVMPATQTRPRPPGLNDYVEEVKKENLGVICHFDGKIMPVWCASKPLGGEVLR